MDRRRGFWYQAPIAPYAVRPAMTASKTPTRPIDRASVAETLIAHKDDLARFHVRSLELFGSTVRGTAAADSDVDMLVTFDRPVDLITFLELENFMAGLLGRPVDLVPRESVKPLLAEDIFSEAVRVY